MIWIIVLSALGVSIVLIMCHMCLLITGSGADDRDGSDFYQSSRQQER